MTADRVTYRPLLLPNQISRVSNESPETLANIRNEKIQKMVEKWLQKAEEQALMRELEESLDLVISAIHTIEKERFGLDILYKATRLLCFVYASQRKWKEVEPLLDDVVDAEGPARGTNAADAMYMLAVNYFFNLNHEKATKWCEMALIWFAGTERWHQQRVQLCYNLLADINEAQGNSNEANFWRGEMHPNFKKGMTLTEAD